MDDSPGRTPMPRTAPQQRHAEESLGFSALKERQLIFLLTRQLAEAQIVKADQARADWLWQEAAALDLDPDRLISLLYGVADHGDLQEMERVDRQYLQSVNCHRSNWWAPTLGRFAVGGFRERSAGASHRSAPRAAIPARS